MKILVCGGRDFNLSHIVKGVLDEIHNHTPITSVVHGGCSGADKLASDWAKMRGITVYPHLANWSEHGRAAGPIRNKAMLDSHPDIKWVIAFPGGKGTESMVSLARRRGIDIDSIILVGAVYD